MSDVEKLDICKDCPIRKYVGRGMVTMVETGYVMMGDIDDEGRTVSFDFEMGEPVQQRESDILVHNLNGAGGHFFHVSGELWDNGEVIQAFKDCEGPTEKHTIFLRRKLACTALKNLDAHETPIRRWL